MDFHYLKCIRYNHRVLLFLLQEKSSLQFRAGFVFMSIIIILHESLTVTTSDFSCLFTVVCHLLPPELKVNIDFMWLSF
jgi:hypothetical protein